MKDELQDTIEKAMEHYMRLVKPKNAGWKVLEIGSRDLPPRGNYQYFGVGNDYKVLDSDESLSPDFVADITDTKMPDGEWDLIIFSQGIARVFDFEKAIRECHRMLKPGGFLIVTCPFVAPYNGDDDYWRISHSALGILLDEVGFSNGRSASFNGILTSALVRK